MVDCPDHHPPGSHTSSCLLYFHSSRSLLRVEVEKSKGKEDDVIITSRVSTCFLSRRITTRVRISDFGSDAGKVLNDIQETLTLFVNRTQLHLDFRSNSR